MIFAVDYDGTIVEHDFPAIGEEREKAIYTLKKLQNLGNQIIIWTCREGEYIGHIKEWFDERDFFPDAINENIDKTPGLAEHKVLADFYIDDRNWPPFEDWQSVLDALVPNHEEDQYE